MSESLEGLYQQAQSAIKARDYAHARELLKQILVVDENYRDASRLLAQTVKLKRRRWYNHPLLWGAVSVAVVISLGFWLTPKLREIYTSLPVIPTNSPTASPAVTSKPTITTCSTEISVPTPTPIPLAWKRVSLGPAVSRDEITAMIQDPEDKDVIYIGTTQAGIYKTINGGVSWQPASEGLDSTRIDSLNVSPYDHKTLLALTGSGPYTSINGGVGWQAGRLNGVNTDRLPWDSMLFVISPTNPKVWYAMGWSIIYISRDAGYRWTPINPEGADIYLWSLDVSATGKYVFVSGRGYPGAHPSFRLETETGQWTVLQFPVGCSVKADPLDDEVAYCGIENGILKTSDAGKTWQMLGYPMVGNVKKILISTSTPKVMFAGGQGFSISRDGGKTWTQSNNGLPGSILELKIDPKSASIFYAQDMTLSGKPIYRSRDSGKNWTLFHTDSCDLMFDADGNLVCGYSRSMDGGTTWVSMNWLYSTWGVVLGSNYPQSSVMLQALVRQNQSDQKNYVSLFVSQNKGVSWQQVNISQYWEWNAPRFYFDHDQGQVVYALDVRGGGEIRAYRTNDFGKTWQDCPSAAYLTSKTDTRLAIDHQDSNHLILASQGNGILASTNGCARWQESNMGLGNLYVNTVSADPNNPDIFYAGTDGGAYISFDGGQTWGEINDGLLGATVVYSIVVDKDSNVYAATPYGIFKLEGK
jgi:photosystem II stability/assembly factor-like uncharacterized protein